MKSNMKRVDACDALTYASIFPVGENLENFWKNSYNFETTVEIIVKQFQLEF